MDAYDMEPMGHTDIAIPQFRTKTGTCRITADEIILARSGARGRLAAWLFGATLWRHLVPFTIAGVLLFVGGAAALFSSRQTMAIYLFIVGALCLLNVWRSRNGSVASTIARATIVRIEPHAPKAGVARGYFVVYYQDNGQERKRLIILPGSLEGGAHAYELALATFRATGLLSS